MSQDVVINGTTYPGVEAVSMTDANGNTRTYFPDAVRYNAQTLTEAQKAQARANMGVGSIDEVVAEVLARLGTPVFGRVDANNNIILTGELTDGTYTLKYEDAEGNVTEIGTLNHSSVTGPVEIPLTWEYGAVLDKTTGKVSSTGNTNYSASNYTEVNPDKTYTLTRDSAMYNTCNVVFYDANNNFVSYLILDLPSLNASGGTPVLSRQLTVPANAAKLRLRLWYEATQDAATVAAMYKLIEE